MIRLGVNSVLFRDFDLPTAARQIARCGYDGIELAAIAGMCEHLALDRWKQQAADIRTIADENGLALLSIEVGALDEERLRPAFEAAGALGVPVVNVGPGGRMGNPDDLQSSLDRLRAMADVAHGMGVTLCVKAHVGQAIHDTATTLAAMEAVSSPGFGVDMDPSHIHRANEDPADALRAVLSRVRHVHIRDCKGRTGGPGDIALQACGRGDINLWEYCRTLVTGGYDGPVCLEVIGANDRALTDVAVVAAESYGFLNGCLKALGAR